MPLLARKGAVLQHHLAHAPDAECRGAYETMLHKLAKEVLLEEKTLLLPSSAAMVGSWRKEVSPQRRLTADAVQIEVPIGPWRADAVAHEGPLAVVVEMLVTHRCDPLKVADFRTRRLHAVEIDLSRLRGLAVDRETIAVAVRAGAPRHWLFNPDTDDEQCRMQAWVEERGKRAAEAANAALAEVSSKIAAANFGSVRAAGPLGSRAQPTSQDPIYDPAEGLDPLAAGLLKGWHTHAMKKQ